MIHLDCAGRVAAATLAAILILPGTAFGRTHVRHHARSAVHAIVPTPKPVVTPDVDEVSMPAAPAVSIIAANPEADSTPRIVKTIRHIYCVEFARLKSGIAIFGDAKTWWQKARGLYAQSFDPKPGAVMVFAGTRKMTHGHVAVVTRIVSSREVLVDHANWRSDGNIYLNAPVIDVSAGNDWSQVRVWDTGSGRLGSRVYPLKGFVSQRADAAASSPDGALLFR
ncbi:MAG: CHAP domain-containing protein [Alphaproteobacteria bacterium]|nr:CHAP domain-containing protein [Alphaproteobacteria bacterium]